jgi:hypothetical protein
MKKFCLESTISLLAVALIGALSTNADRSATHRITPGELARACHAPAWRDGRTESLPVTMLFDWLIVGQIVPTNPAAAVRGLFV